MGTVKCVPATDIRMNFLAHVVLGRAGGCGAAVSLLGDFVRGRPEGRYHGAALAGIRLHRRIDSYVDAHAAHARARARLAGPWRRYAPVLVDVYFDHLLARRFESLVGAPLAPYSQRVYAELHRAADALPPDLNRFAVHARARDLFTGYRQGETIAAVLDGIGRRLRRPVPLGAAMDALRAVDGPLADDFAQLWPDVLALARDTAGPPLPPPDPV